jgi:hypothetical protein
VHRVQPGQANAYALSMGGRSWLRSVRLGPDSPGWLALVSLLFISSELAPALLRLPLGADEITYIARTSARHSGVFLPPVHGQGAGLLAAPVTLLTDSLTALRVWMALLSGIALFGSLACWRGLRPAWVLAIAGAMFGGLAITEFSGVQVYPDLWGAFGTLAVTGLLLQTVQGRLRGRLTLPLIAFAAFVIVLMRPQNIVFVLAPTLVAAIVMRGWRKPGVIVAMIIGIAAGILEWVAGAYLWFGGLASRIRLASQEPPKLGLTFSLPMQIKTLSGPWYCDAPPYGTCHPGYSYPVIYLWWLAFLALVVLGLAAAWRTRARASSVLAAATGGWVALLFLLLVPFGAPRYFLPTWALFAILAADGIVCLARTPWRSTAGTVVAAAFLLSWIASQHVVLAGEASRGTSARPFARSAAAARKLGVKPPCALQDPSVAYFLGCTAPWTGAHVAQALAMTPGGANAWREVRLPQGSRVLRIWVRR